MAVLRVELRAAAGQRGGDGARVLHRDEAVALAVPDVDLAPHVGEVEAPRRAARDVVVDHPVDAARGGGEERVDRAGGHLVAGQQFPVGGSGAERRQPAQRPRVAFEQLHDARAAARDQVGAAYERAQPQAQVHGHSPAGVRRAQRRERADRGGRDRALGQGTRARERVRPTRGDADHGEAAEPEVVGEVLDGRRGSRAMRRPGQGSERPKPGRLTAM